MNQIIKERPILFKAEMVRAILSGNKTQTRRIVKGMAFEWIENAKFNAEFVAHPDNSMCPYGNPGDRLWVREMFQPVWADGYDFDSEVLPDYKTGVGYKINYPATNGIIEWLDGDEEIRTSCKPSIHMPRWASRILLEIIDVRVERLIDISEEDAKEEGVNETMEPPIGKKEQFPWNHRLGFAWLWVSINGAGSWEANPWVWVIEFKRVEQQ